MNRISSSYPTRLNGQSLGSLVLALILGSALPAQDGGGAQPQGQAPAEESSSEKIAEWVTQLSADQYYVRDAATRNLIKAGRVAVAAVKKALNDSDLEVTTRGIFILQQLALGGDLETEEAARQALETLAAARVTAAARRASDALATLKVLKQEHALKQLEQLGATVDPEHIEVGLTGISVLAVEVGDQWRGQEQDLRRLQWLRDVEQITFVGKRVTDQWLAHIHEMQNLMTVKINAANVTSTALEHLKTLPRLRYVKLLYVPIGDEAYDRLKQCPQIEKVLAFGTRLTPAGKARLEELGMEVDRRQGAFLGISVPRSNEGADWFIDRVTENSAADKAGLEARDVVVKYDGREVKDFPSLMTMISQNEAGDSVTIHVRRGAEILIKEITFGQWE